MRPPAFGCGFSFHWLAAPSRGRPINQIYLSFPHLHFLLPYACLPTPHFFLPYVYLPAPHFLLPRAFFPPLTCIAPCFTWEGCRDGSTDKGSWIRKDTGHVDSHLKNDTGSCDEQISTHIQGPISSTIST